MMSVGSASNSDNLKSRPLAIAGTEDNSGDKITGRGLNQWSHFKF